jgi:hypothetical protein
LAQCTLVVDDRLVVRSNVTPENLKAGLEKLQRELIKNHKASNFWHFSMKKFPAYVDKVWRWDFAPAGDKASTRLSWRLFAYVPDYRDHEPKAYPFVCWNKDDEPKGNYIPFLAKVLKAFLTERVVIQVEENIFTDRVDSDGITHSMCELCWEHLESADLDELDILKSSHKENCPRHPPE